MVCRKGHALWFLVVVIAVYLHAPGSGRPLVASAAELGVSPSAEQECQSLQPQLRVNKQLLPLAHVDTRANNVTVVVEWQLDVTVPTFSLKSEECRFLVRVTDGLPPAPLRVPSEMAPLFTTTHNQSLVHREHAFTLRKDEAGKPFSLRDTWTYTLLLQPMSLSPLNDSLRVALPLPHLALFSVLPEGEAVEIASAVPAAPVELTVSLYYAPPAMSVQTALGLSVACVALVLVGYLLVARRLESVVRAREEVLKAKQKRHGGSSVVVPSKPVTTPNNTTNQATTALSSVAPVSPDTRIVDHPSPSSSEEPVPSSSGPYRFKAKDTRKRFTRTQPGASALDF